MRVEIDLARLRAARDRLRAAGEDLDGLGTRMPRGGDYGDAGALVELALAVQAEGSALVSAEATMVAFAVGLCLDDLECTDAQQAVDLITLGDRL